MSEKNMFSKKISYQASLLTLLLLANSAMSAVFPLPKKGTDIIGNVQVVYTKPNDTLIEIGDRYEMGFDELKWANPTIGSWAPGADTAIVIPSQYILPNVREGIIVNIPEMRAYYFPKDQNVVYTYPISVGRMDWKTPIGKWKVTAKQEDPNWYPTENVRREHALDGDILPKVVAKGPDNPLGRHVLRLNIPSYLLHGTNDPTGIGMRVTHGCIRFFPKNIEELYKLVPIGTAVHMTNEIIKLGWDQDKLLIAVHASLEEDHLNEEEVIRIAKKLLKPYQDDPGINIIDNELFEEIVKQMSGIPVEIGKRVK